MSGSLQLCFHFILILASVMPLIESTVLLNMFLSTLMWPLHQIPTRWSTCCSITVSGILERRRRHTTQITESVGGVPEQTPAPLHLLKSRWLCDGT